MALPFASLAVGFLDRLRFPTLFKITLVLAAVSWLWPFDPIPFVDEIVTGLGLLLLARMKRRDPDTKPPIDAEVERRA